MKKPTYPELVAEIARHGDTRRLLAKLLEIAPNSMCRKIYGKSEWTISEIDFLCKRYNRNYHELFKKGNE